MQLSAIGFAFLCLLFVVMIVSLAFVVRRFVYNVNEERCIREQLLESHTNLITQIREEQREWRQRRLQNVVLLLIQRGEVMEGIPLAAQIPGHREVLCRRKIRQARARQRLADEILDEVREEEERSVFPTEVYETTLMTLNELLANGRPAEAEAGPDIMQMLLDGQEPHQLSPSDWDNDNNNDDDDDTNSEYWIDVTQQNTRNTSLITSPLQPESLSQSHEQEEESPHLSSHPLHTSDNNNMSNNTSNNITSTNHTEQEQQQQEEQSEHHDSSNSNNNNNNNNSIVVPDITNNMTEAEARHARWLEERRTAIVRELHAEQARKQRRRRTAEEVYGVGVPYLTNPLLLEREVHSDIIEINESNEEEPQSPIMRFLSPLSPFNKSNRFASKENSEHTFSHTSSFVFVETTNDDNNEYLMVRRKTSYTNEYTSPNACSSIIFTAGNHEPY